MKSSSKILKQNILIPIVAFSFILLSLLTFSFNTKNINLNNKNSRLNSINLTALTVSTTSLPNATICSLSSTNCLSYYFNLQAVGGVSPYTFSVVKGSLPYGLALGTGGAISGTPYFFDQPGIYNFEVQVKDSASNVAVSYLSLDLLNPSSSLIITTTTLPSLNTCSMFSSCSNYYQVLNATGGKSPYTFSVVKGSLPYGLALSSNGAISGSPYFFDQPGIYNFEVQVKDSASNVAYSNFSLDLL